MGKIKNEFFYTEDMYKEYSILKSNVDIYENITQWAMATRELKQWIRKNKITKYMIVRMNMRIKPESKVNIGKPTVDVAEEYDAEIYEFATEIFNMKVNSTIDWEYGKADLDILMGTKKLWMFDCLLIMSASYGGGLENVLWMQKDTKPRDIYKWLMDTYIEPKFN